MHAASQVKPEPQDTLTPMDTAPDPAPTPSQAGVKAEPPNQPPTDPNAEPAGASPHQAGADMDAGNVNALSNVSPMPRPGSLTPELSAQVAQAKWPNAGVHSLRHFVKAMNPAQCWNLWPN